MPEDDRNKGGTRPETQTGGAQAGAGKGTESAPKGGTPGHETSDVDTKDLLKLALLMVVTAIVILGILWVMLSYYNQPVTTPSPAVSSVIRGQREELPPEPRLQIAPGSKSALKTPDYEMKEVQNQMESELNSYGWIDRNNGRVRIPIDEAKKLLLQKGVPTLPGAAQPKPRGTEAWDSRAVAPVAAATPPQ